MAASSPDILIVGAGVLGLCSAATLRLRGHRVTTIDPGGDNASSVAAGMIAPAMESAVEDVTPDRAALFRGASAMWPEFADRTGVTLIRADAGWRGEGADTVAARLANLGFAAEATAGGVRTPDDLRLSPEAALARLSAGIERVEAPVRAMERDDEGWTLSLADGGRMKAGTVVIATGAEAVIAGLPDTVRQLIESIVPVRGQIGRTSLMLTGRTLRGPGVYVTPVDGGTLIGATMETGRRDLTPDAETGERLRLAAEALLGQAIDPAAIEWRVGVRGASLDGLPMAGGVAPRLMLALAPRRNGWLLGPMVGQVVADAVEGRAPGRWAAALDPMRFSPPAG